jgi:abhydrolase domain-containing protein 6
MNKLIHAAVFFLILALFSGCASFKQSLFDLSMSAEYSRSDLEPKRIVSDGITMTYLERTGENETIVLVHGFGANKDNWVRFVRHLPDTYRVIAVDLPGHGDSSQIMQDTYTIEYITKGFADMIDALGIKQFHLAGNSLGGYVAMLYTVNNPGRVLSLGLIDPAGVDSPQPSDLQLAIQRGENPLIPKTRNGFEELMEYGFVKQPFLPWPVRSVVAEKYIAHSTFNQKMWNDIWSNRRDAVYLLEDIQSPTFLIWGDKDRILHVSSAEVYKRHIKGLKTVIMKDCGHAPMLERPKETAGSYISFLQAQRG